MRIEFCSEVRQEVGVKWNLAEGRCRSGEMVSGLYLFSGLMSLDIDFTKVKFLRRKQ